MTPVYSFAYNEPPAQDAIGNMAFASYTCFAWSMPEDISLLLRNTPAHVAVVSCYGDRNKALSLLQAAADLSHSAVAVPDPDIKVTPQY